MTHFYVREEGGLSYYCPDYNFRERIPIPTMAQFNKEVAEFEDKRVRDGFVAARRTISEDIADVDDAIMGGNSWSHQREAWSRLKKALYEAGAKYGEEDA